MSYELHNFINENRIVKQQKGPFSVIEHQFDKSVTSNTAQTEYFMSKMNVRRRQLLVELDGRNEVIIQAGAMQWYVGNIEATSGIKGASDFLGKMIKGAVTKESASKPHYIGKGKLMLEPTYKHLLLIDVSDYKGGLTLEDGMFLACESTVDQKIVSRTNLSSAILGGEGLFNLSLSGHGIAALESYVPEEELIEIELVNETLKIDGNLAVCWSSSLEFTVEKAISSLIGSAISGEGFVNVYRGTGKVLMCPVASTNLLQTILK
ncbi:MAG: AIM24 family protein [Erysipelotrichaceae bacterium]|jgi:uncharacterized protein (AIM24 family)